MLTLARLGLDDIRNCQLHPIERRQLSPNSINCFLSAVQFLYTVTLDMPWSKERFGRMKVPEKLAFFRYVGILKHRNRGLKRAPLTHKGGRILAP
jgi:hypothetical protein